MAGPQGADVPPIAMVDPPAATVVHRPSSTTNPDRVSSHSTSSRPVLLVVVPQNGELPQASFQSPEDRLDPLDHVVVLDDIARDENQVSGPAAAELDDPFEEPAIEAPGEVEVAELDDLQTIERCRAGRAPSLPTREAKRNES